MAKPDCCDCCDFETTALKSYREEKPNSGGKKWFCALCAGTMTSQMFEFSELNDADTVRVMQTICHVGNVILAAIAKSSEKP